MALDEARGLVFVPTGSAAPDFHGADRIGDNLFANCLLALDAATGQAGLALPGRASRHLGSRLPVAAHARDRAARRPHDRRGGADDQARLRLRPRSRDRRAALPGGGAAVAGRARVPGERAVAHAAGAAPSRSRSPARRLTADLLTRRTPEAHAWAAAEFAKMHNGGPFTPLADRHGHGRLPGIRRRRGMGRQRLRPGLGAAVRQRQRPGLDRVARARRRRHRRAQHLPEVVRAPVIVTIAAARRRRFRRSPISRRRPSSSRR